MTGTFATGWATGDVIVASEFKKTVGAIFDSTLGGVAASIDVTSIISNYQALQIVFYGRGDFAAASEAVVMRFNGDVGNNYDYQFVRGLGATASAVETLGVSFGQIGNIPANTAAANKFSTSVAWISNYSNTTNHKSWTSTCGNPFNTTTGTIESSVFGGCWRSTAAINRVTLVPGSGGNFNVGSRLTIYGYGA